MSGSKINPLNISPELRECLSTVTQRLYRYDLPNAREAFEELVQKLETELSIDDVLVDHLCLKLARDLSGYVSVEDAIWLVRRRADRAATSGHRETRYRSLVNCNLVAEQCDDQDITAEFLDKLTAEADQQGREVIKELLPSVILFMVLSKQNSPDNCHAAPEECQEHLSGDDLKSSSPEEYTEFCEDVTDEKAFYFIVTLERMAFQCKQNGDKDLFRHCYLKALDMCRERDVDLGLRMEVETNWIRAIKSTGKQEELEVHVNSLLNKIELALEDFNEFQLMFGIKVLRDAYNDVSVACSFHWMAKDQLLRTGVELYNRLVEQYGLHHHEVLFLASQLAYNYETFEMADEADKYVDIVQKNLESFPETTKMIMQAKAKTYIHLWKVYRNRGRLGEAEIYCREELRVNRKHGISQQYVANALRNLAFILKELERRDEGLDLLKECLQLSKKHSPSLTAFHEKVENEIRKF